MAAPAPHTDARADAGRKGRSGGAVDHTAADTLQGSDGVSAFNGVMRSEGTDSFHLSRLN